MLEKPFSPACENNKQPILRVLEHYLARARSVLEVGTGTGQHAVFFAEHLPHVVWQTSDLPENHAGIHAWLNEYSGSNLKAPIPLDVASGPWPDSMFDAVFTANTAHIMAWHEVLAMLAGVKYVLPLGGFFVVYGPFNYEGRFTSESNAQFNLLLKQQAPHRAIRDFEAICDAAATEGLSLLEDIAMPSNNRCLVFRKTAHP